MTNCKLKNKSNIDHDLLKLYINTICQSIIEKTNRKTFPDQLKYLVIELVNDKFETDISANQPQTIQSMSEDGRSVNFGISSAQASKLNLLVQRQLEDHDRLINRYKLVYRV